MRVWLVTTGEPLPTDSSEGRLLRTAILAEQMASNGTDVVFWSSTYDHMRKRQRANRNRTLEVQPNYQLRLLFAPGYRANISLRRHWHHRAVARQFRKEASRAERPDIILCSLPTLELCHEAVELGCRFNIPVVLDVRDLWPDLLLDLIPRPARVGGRIAFHPMFQSVRHSCKHATAITGATPAYVNWGLAYAGREATPLDRNFPMGYVD